MFREMYLQDCFVVFLSLSLMRKLMKKLKKNKVKNYEMWIFWYRLKVILALNPLTDNPTKWSNALKQFVGNLPTNCLSVFDHFVGLPLKRLNYLSRLQKLVFFLVNRLILILVNYMVACNPQQCGKKVEQKGALLSYFCNRSNIKCFLNFLLTFGCCSEKKTKIQNLE